VTAGPVYLWSRRLLSGVEACFDLVGTSKTLLYVDRMRCVVRDHVRIESENHVAC
jgi:hypothetical protein